MFAPGRIVAPPGWSRWLVPPAALSIHLAIGQAYAWSVFKPPLESSLHLSGTASALPFQVAIVMLGLSAAFGGTLVERRGPRWAMTVAAVCFSSGFLVAALGAELRQYWLVVLGYGAVGGVGLGIGYISPVSTLLSWFPDRPGTATGIAIMGFGGGALIASPWSAHLLSVFGTSAPGIARTFAVMGVAYGLFMTLGVLLVRVPPGRTGTIAAPPLPAVRVSARNALRTPQFWCLWVMLCANVTAGIGILEKAAPMVTSLFAATPAAAAGFVGLLSLANMLGRLAWSAASDLTGRKNIYRLYLGAGAGMYLLLALVGGSSKPVFLLCAAVILSFYGGGFATLPAYLKDLFGTYQVGAIHGRLLTAWSTAGILGPLIVNALADARRSAGHSGADLYTPSFFTMLGLLAVGFVVGEFVRPVHPRYHEPPDEDGRPASVPEEGVAP
ncbi:MFS transporter [Streptomyces griseocarneus]|nr:MFS transporter [Streptomyces griseocarneus]